MIKTLSSSFVLLAAAASGQTILASSALYPTPATAQVDPFLLFGPECRKALPGDPILKKCREDSERRQLEEQRKRREQRADEERKQRERYLDYEKNPSKYKVVQDLQDSVPKIDAVSRIHMFVAAESAALGGDGRYLIHGRLEGRAVVLSRQNDCAHVATPVNAINKLEWTFCTGKQQTPWEQEIIKRAAARAAHTGQPQRITIDGYTFPQGRTGPMKPYTFKGAVTSVEYKESKESSIYQNSLTPRVCVKYKFIDDKLGLTNF